MNAPLPFDRGWRRWTVGITGMNAIPDNPGPGLAVARCLRAAGFEGRIVGLGYETLDAGLYHGGLCDAAYLMPYPAVGAEAQRARLGEIQLAERLDFVIPCLDAELTTFVDNQAALRAMGIGSLLPDRRQLAARAKDNLVALCERLGLPVPRTKVATNPAFFDTCESDGWRFPLVVKGPYYDAAVVGDPAEASRAFARIAAQWGYPVLVQEFVRGYEVNLTAIGDGDGGMIAPVMMRKRALTDKGKAWAGVAISDPELEALAAKLIEGLRWRGPLEVEAMRSDEGLYLIEINPRFPAWTYLTHGVGRNLPEALLRLAAGERLAEPVPPAPGVMFIRYAEELIVSPDSFRSIMVDGALNAAPRPSRMFG
ncbi:MAG: ATP-grasp domain-containing protein [Alphaproteobacteria bacterium]|nr:ATP-grasp domain-containing protein [Alphaproteobacteria bacterium]